MALIDYRKLCPRSGHVLSREEREAVTRDAAAPDHGPTIRCDACGRDVVLIVHPGTGRSLIYPMHVKAAVAGCSGAAIKRQPCAS